MAHGALYNVAPVIDLLPKDLHNKKILDIGFGYGQVMHTIMSFSYGKQYHFTGEPYIIGIDKNPDNVEFAKKWMPFYRDVYLYDAVEVPYPANITKDVKIIICTEVVEHTLDKNKTLKMIEYLRDLAPLVIFTCPNGNALSPKVNDYHTHNTIWYEKDFKKLGFKTKLVSRLDFEGEEQRLITYLIKFVNIFRPYNKTIINTIVAWKDDEQ
jgi:SAM-dependent methyltransferase